jgi:hypothetical protein
MKTTPIAEPESTQPSGSGGAEQNATERSYADSAPQIHAQVVLIDMLT